MQVEQCTKLNHEVHRGVTFFHRLSVKRGRQYMYSTTIFPLKTHISEKNKVDRYKLEMLRDRLIIFVHAFVHH